MDNKKNEQSNFNLKKAQLARGAVFTEAQLAFILGVGDLLNTKIGYKGAINKILSLSLKAIQVSKGCVYLKNEKNKTLVKTSIGFSPDEKNLLKDFCQHQKLLSHIIKNKKIVTVPLAGPVDIYSEEILKKLNLASGIFIPILSKDQEGIVFLEGGENNEFSEDDLSRYQQVAVQMGQMISFIKRYQLVSASEKRYRSLMENASCSMFIADLEGNLLETNKEGEKLTGCSKEELIGKKVRDFLTPDFKKQLAEWMKDLETNHYITLTAIQIQRVDGSVRTVEGSVVLVDVGREVLFLMIGTDVTEINYLRGKALLNDKLATIGLLAAGVAHEINNPMAWIISNFDLLSEQLSEVKALLNAISDSVATEPESANNKKVLTDLLLKMDHHKRFQMLDEILQESMLGAKRIQGIVQDLRSNSRPDGNCFEKIDLHKVLDSAINMVMPDLKYRAQVIKNYAANVPLVTLNEGKIHQVILNLIVNAVHSLEEAKASENQVIVTTCVKSNQVVITIEDTGKGIDANHLSQIFDPFFTTKPVGTGTGLGLFICHEIVRNMGGDITVNSTLGKGSIFTILLPISSVPQSEKLI